MRRQLWQKLCASCATGCWAPDHTFYYFCSQITLKNNWSRQETNIQAFRYSNCSKHNEKITPEALFLGVDWLQSGYLVWNV
ncbi:hypothetical protein F5Y19DRAFT_425937 [Xylariaceae sp. FL1651]|nr:hypothetical protein F5Y19DRAFT_425937 [Xylariaceae sp. FL1651]